MSDKQFDCPQCGFQTEALHEGYCEACCTSNQAALDAHNHQHDRWARLSDSQRDSEINRAHR
ncbi:hypothetical protein I7860_24625 [Pseudomonas tolaasii]|uniref:hypothetical protein n=1 Tax=Pseudomonas tolaasii TaxID=29442 RepID=UPI001C579645|nr:hypothetical protein [Pseudomonas tolaasii]MBW1249864.1 hypothetical protein [Pseudomonas tolaasii]